MGISVGQSLSSARALYPSIKVFDHDPVGDNKDLNRLALWCIRYSPWVRSDHQDGILMDITGCPHLFGGEKALCCDIETRIEQMGFEARVAITNTLGAAWAISRYGVRDQNIIKNKNEIGNALSSLSIAALRVDDKVSARLSKVGLHTIGALLHKPRAPLAARYGKTLVDRLDQALGYKAESLTPIAEPPDYRTTRRFLEPVLMLAQMQECLSGLVEALMDTLSAGLLGARQFALFLYRIDGDVRTINVRTSILAKDRRLVVRLLFEKLEELVGNYDVGFGIEQITLGAYHTEPITQSQINIEGKKENGSRDDFQALIDRYGNRLGFENVGQFLQCESHIPERSEKLVSVAGSSVNSKSWEDFLNDLQGSTHFGRPIVLLPHPEPITAIAEVPDGPPVRFKWRRLMYKIIKAEGPERLSPEWWLTSLERREPTRDYFRVEDQEGGRFWLFRRGLYERKQKPEWFMHGFFA
mgnify:CR=1 FL=1